MCARADVCHYVVFRLLCCQNHTCGGILRHFTLLFAYKRSNEWRWRQPYSVLYCCGEDSIGKRLYAHTPAHTYARTRTCIRKTLSRVNISNNIIFRFGKFILQLFNPSAHLLISVPHYHILPAVTLTPSGRVHAIRVRIYARGTAYGCRVFKYYVNVPSSSSCVGLKTTKVPCHIMCTYDTSRLLNRRSVDF